MKQVWNRESPSQVWLLTFTACNSNPNLSYADAVFRADRAMSEYAQRFGDEAAYRDDVTKIVPVNSQGTPIRAIDIVEEGK